MSSHSKGASLKIYTDATPNGFKVTAALSMLDIEYELHVVDISTQAQKEPWYLNINPNGRIPALVHQRPCGDSIRIFETGSILLYIAENFDLNYHISYPRGTSEYYESINWLFFQTSSMGPMQGQAHHFARYAPVKVPYGIDRYVKETRRLYAVLESHLSDTSSSFLVGEKLTISDISVVTWVIYAKWASVDMTEFPHLGRWRDRVIADPKVLRGLQIPRPLDIEAMLTSDYAAAASKWIMADGKGQ